MAEPISGNARQDAQNQQDGVDGAEEAGSTPRKVPGRDPRLIEREELLASMDAKIEQQRKDDYERFIDSADDPRAALARAMEAESRGEPIATDKGHRDLEVPAQEGKPVQDAAARQAREAVRISNKGEDPLGDYVVRVEGKPMFKTIVNDKEVLIPLDRARAELQQHIAANIRLEGAKERTRQLDARERNIRATEETLKARSHPAATPAPVVDDKALAAKLVRSLVSEPEDRAVETMAEAFRSIRSANTTPAVDARAIAREAAAEVRKEIAESAVNSALQSGLTKFTEAYPDIAADSDLFSLADKKTDEIASEHPEWSPEQVMLEAGAKTREWLKSIGAPVKGTAPASQTNNRQQRKQTLVPMPQPRTARPAVTQDEPGQSPQQAIEEIRKARGQPY